MKAFLEPLRGLESFIRLKQLKKTVDGPIGAVGCTDAQKAHLLYGLGQEDGVILMITADEQSARKMLESCRCFFPQAAYFPARDILFYQSDIRGNALTQERMTAYRALFEQEQPVIVTTFDALMDRLVAPEVMQSFILRLRVQDTVDMDQIRKGLAGMGYACQYQVEEPGQFAVRGGILDIFPLTEEVPYRIELWGDEIDSIRSFSPESQRSIENMEEAVIYPASELVLSPETAKKGWKRLEEDAQRLYAQYRATQKTQEAARIRSAVEYVREQILESGDVRAAESYLAYFYEQTVGFLDIVVWQAAKRGVRCGLYVDEPARCMERAGVVEAEFADSIRQRLEKGYVLPGQADALFSSEQIAAALSRQSCLLLFALEQSAQGIFAQEKVWLSVRSVNSYNGSFELLVKDLRRYKKEQYSVILLCSSPTRAERMAADLRDEGLNAFFGGSADRVVMSGEIMVLYGKQKRGFEYPEVKFVVLTETDIFGMEKKKRRKKRFSGEKILDFTQLLPGDYVVHENHGIGIYRGIEKIEVNRTARDYMKIEYEGSGVLYVLATQLDMIQKYAGAASKKPKLNRLGGQKWAKTRSHVHKAVGEVARELVELYAARQNREGYQYGEDTIWQREFEEMFPYEETADQQAAIQATKADMQSKKIMDRLICGDVGFGKTEIAIRAAFKAVQEGKQVVYLVPTTILAQQHYDTFAQRMREFPVNIELLCRFRTSAQQKRTVEKLKKGLVDIVIGTHRVLSGDVDYKDLGLLIIDEEQRFGVTHKEKIKQLKKDVDVLTLTATPIPRTLHMSLIGIRDMSVLEEPPRDRIPVQTYVMDYNEEMVREAIERELARGGQVYYVFNRVNQIPDVAAGIARLVARARVAYAHGQMGERELENVMYRFINREIDVLVSTTIIETGLDISNVNTMIIHDADRMGLSQLYQLRGRIGRSNRTAYAFLMYRRDKVLKEVAEKRLSAIREFSELGSGFKIAMKDLELRGAGNLLGEEQHGHMEAVGYDLYCKMLGEAVRAAKGEEVEESFETSVDVELDAYIPPTYIVNEEQKLDVYKRIAAIRNEAERDEMLDELIDRFGEPPRSVQNLLTVARMRAQAHEVYLEEIKEKPDGILFRMFARAKLNPANIPLLLKRHKPLLTFTADKKEPCFFLRRTKNGPDTVGLIMEMIRDCRELLLLR